MTPNPIVAIAIACGLIFLGAYAAAKIDLSVASRAAVGAVLLVGGIALIYPLIGVGGALEAHQIRFGTAVALIGLGINQLAAPLRLALGRPV
ncbi:MAG: hypothetical protein EON58_08545 [Alphaproteobacteria bacterium]|nr:MAG: hypothetical protein EON58_08545 [Alphaproteobacteria bacterium]